VILSLINTTSSIVTLPGQAAREPENFTYAVIDYSDLSDVDFNDIPETASNIIISNDNTKFIISWYFKPDFIRDGSVVAVATYTYNEYVSLLNTPAWN